MFFFELILCVVRSVSGSDVVCVKKKKENADMIPRREKGGNAAAAPCYLYDAEKKKV